jgi:hypothetical protein
MAHVVSVTRVVEAPSEDVWALAIEDIGQRALRDLNWRPRKEEVIPEHKEELRGVGASVRGQNDAGKSSRGDRD